MANYPQELVQDAVCKNHTGHMTGLWFLPARPVRLNTNEWMSQMMVEGILILRQSPLNGRLVWLLKFFHVKWLVFCGVERQRYCTHVCWLCCSLWLITVTNCTDTYTLIILYTVYLPMFWDNYQSDLLGSNSPRNVGINVFCVTRQKSEDLTYNAAESWNHESLLLLSFSSPGIYIATRKSKGFFFFQGCREGWILKTAHFLENYNNTDDWQYQYIQGRCSYICCIKQGRETHALWATGL